MPRVKNVDCAACNQRITYEYAIHRKTFLHKLNAAKYNNNGSLIYNDSIDLDKTSERINAQTLRLYNKEADKRAKIIKQQKKTAAKSQKKQHTNFQNLRKTAATANKHLQPKAKLNILQTKWAIEDELFYRRQLESINKVISVTPGVDDDDYDLHHFKLTPKKKQFNCIQSNSRQSGQLFSSNYTSTHKSQKHRIVPLANSTQINTTFTSDEHTDNYSNNTAFASAVIKNISFLNKTNTSNKPIQCFNEPSLTPELNHITSMDTSDIQLADHFRPEDIQHISQIPLPQGSQRFIANITKTAEIYSHNSIFDSKATEDISFFTSFYIEPIRPTIHLNIPHNNHVNCYSPPKSPDDIIHTQKSIQPSFNLKRVDITRNAQDNAKQACRICGALIDFGKLIILANRMPSGRQIYCASCLLMFSSKSKDVNVDYFNQL